MDKYEVRFEFDRLPKIVKFFTVEAAKRFYDKKIRLENIVLRLLHNYL